MYVMYDDYSMHTFNFGCACIFLCSKMENDSAALLLSLLTTDSLR